MSGEERTDATAYTVRELLFQLVTDIRRLEEKFDVYIDTHSRDHTLSELQTTLARTDPDQTPVGRRVIALEGRVELLERRNEDADAVARERTRIGQKTQWFIGLVAGIAGAVGAAALGAVIRVLAGGTP